MGEEARGNLPGRGEGETRRQGDIYEQKDNLHWQSGRKHAGEQMAAPIHGGMPGIRGEPMFTSLTLPCPLLTWPGLNWRPGI